MKISPFILRLASFSFFFLLVPDKGFGTHPTVLRPKQETAQQNQVATPSPKLPADSENDMRAIVSLSAVDQPVSVILQSLSASSGVTLEAPSALGVQRMTLCVKNKSLYDVAGRIVETLSHRIDTAPCYFWEASVQNGKRIFTLRTTALAQAEYRNNLDQPRRDAIQILTDYRAVAQLPQEERSAYTGLLPPSAYKGVDNHPYAQALKALTPPQFASLIRRGSVTLSAAKIKDVLAATAKTNPQRNEGIIKSPDGPYHPPVSQIRLTFFSAGDYGRSDRYNGENNDPVLSEIYGFQMGGVYSSLFLINNFQDEKNIQGLLPQTEEKQPVYDLSRLINNETPFQKHNDLGYVLSALSQVTGAAIYEEHFLRPGYLANGYFGSGVPYWETPVVYKGTLPQIVNSICKKWQYQVTQAENGDLLFWSRRWGRDKQADISEKTLEPWRRRLKENGRFSEADYLDMAQTLSYPQIKITLPYAFDFDEDATKEFLNLWQRHQYLARRVSVLLSPTERQAALSRDGIALGDIAARQTILSELRFASDEQVAAEHAGDFSVPSPNMEQILQSRVFLSGLEPNRRTEWNLARVGSLPYDPLTLTIKTRWGCAGNNRVGLFVRPTHLTLRALCFLSIRCGRQCF